MMNNPTLHQERLIRSLLIAMTAAAAAAVWLCIAVPGFALQPTPQPRRASGLKAVTMEQKLHQDIQDAQHAGRNTAAAQKLKAKGDAELREGRLHAAIKHYADAEKAVGAAK
jgi:hypothetical protein